MKIFSNFAVILALVAFTTACKKEKKNETTATEAEVVAEAPVAAVKYKAIPAESTIEWKGSKPTGNHTGTVAIESGTVSVKEGQIESGSFIIDMNTITVTDLKAGDGKEDLEAHLKGSVEDKKDHFFDVAKFPNAAFEITEVKEAEGKTMLSGNLTLKGVKKNISFPVTVTEEGDNFTLTSEPFTINRTDWGVNYGSKSVFDNLGDKFINDDIELKITLKASKA
ncbi:YceI family protein [Abyssalbus ytuae]|uniref:YceI family protein n=1 Tax=Abyssalbus ytuae TaxID=2926907 RepID=A0A9E6ZT19_9FLAO|nr:YceI family protein [Abyssalbus ytuae]UOB18318.1 YceI family protein [Abyssalbus ytuae]